MFTTPPLLPQSSHVTYPCVCVQGLSYTGKAVHLRGHDGPINCMMACKPFGIVVTGSADHTCIIWDTNRSVTVICSGQVQVQIMPFVFICTTNKWSKLLFIKTCALLKVTCLSSPSISNSRTVTQNINDSTPTLASSLS